MNLLQVTRSLLGDDTGLGKAQPIDTPVLTPSGWRRIGDLTIGDYVIGSNGLRVRVDGIFPQGMKRVYRVIMSDDSSTECCDEHLWTVRSGNTRRSGSGWRTLSLKQIVKGGLLRQKGSTGRKWSIPMVEPVLFMNRELPVDPYLLGVLLGDGSMPGSLSVCNGDPKLFDLLEAHLPSDCRLGKLKKDGYSKPIIGKPGVRNSLKKGLLSLGLIKKNWSNKFIPKVYLTASLHQRVNLLRGLMDTDGYVSKDGYVTQFFSSNLELVNNFVELIRSLGGTATVASKIPTLRGKSKAKRGRLAYTVTISLPNSIIPFNLPRKVSRWRPRTKYLPIRYIDKVIFSRDAECVCIKVDSHDSLYVTNDYIVTHNTLEVLSVIGYVWLVEPDYVPIVVTRKSSLYQWRDEANRFMTGISVVVSDGEPFERDEIYKDFFFNHDPSKKRLLVMTYDTFLKDAEQSVVRDRSQKPTKDDKKRLKEAKDFKKSLAETYATWKTKFRTRFDGRDQATKDFLIEKLKPSDEEMGCRAKPPSDWTPEDEAVLAQVLSLRHGMEEADKAIAVAKDAVEPPMIAEGLLKHLAKFRKKNPNTKMMLVCDEIHVLKNYQGKLHKLFYIAAKPFNRVVGMTATPVKNRLMEFFAIFRIIYPELFPKVTHFQRDYCVMKMQRIGGGRQIPVVVGHSKEQLEAFVQKVEPFYLSRRKHDVAKELPELITREIICTLSPEQEELYDLAELLLAEAEANPDDDNTQTLKTMTMIRQACDAPQLLADEEGKPFEGESSKIDQLVEILQENPDAKVLVFSAFERMISLIEARLKKEKINCTRITGKESNAKVRTEHVRTYQDPDSGVNVMLITSAGSESLNLQATEHLVFVDSPFSYGDYVQTIGRPQRIGSKHLTVLITHLVARRQNGEKTIDDHVIKILRGKKKLADSVSGEALKGGLQFTESDLVKEVMNLVLDAKRTGDRAGAKEKMKHIHSTSSKKQKPVQKDTKQNSAASATSKMAAGLYLDLDFSDI